MLDQPTDNVKLTAEQILQLDIVKKRLTTLESEVGNAGKVLKGIKLETDRAVKEKTYQDEQCAAATLQAETAKAQLEVVQKELTESSATLLATTTETADLKAIYDIKAIELKDREDSIAHKERELDVREGTLNAKQNTLEEETHDFNTKVTTLKELLSTF